MIGQLTRRALLSQSTSSAIKIPVRTMYPQVSSNIVSGVPRNRIPFAEKVATGIFLGACILLTPAWIITHMDDYRGGAIEQ